MSGVMHMALLLQAAVAMLALLSPHASKAQMQNSLGGCSPNITGQFNRVQTTCLLYNNRIRIAQLSGDYNDQNYSELNQFLRANDQNIIYLDIAVGFTAYKNPWSKTTDPRTSEDLNSLTFHDPGGGGWLLNFRNTATFYVANGTYQLQGFFIPMVLYGVHQGYTETYLETIDKKIVLFSDKYVFGRER
jgi:hypothetical protein